MRGLAVLAAAGGVWLALGGSISMPPTRMPRIKAATVAGAIASGGAVFILLLGLLGAAVPAGALGLLAVTIPFQLGASRERRRRQEDAATWPDLLAHIRSSVAAGQTVPDAYVDAAERVGGSFLETLDVVRREMVFGGGFSDAMNHVQRHADDATADRVTMTLSVANETGGTRVGDVLAALSASVAGETRLRAAHDAALTEQRWTAGVALAAPWVILALSIATNPQAALAFSTAEGAVVVGIGLAATVSGYVLAMRLAALSEAPRMFG